MKALVQKLYDAQSRLLAVPAGSPTWRAAALALQQTVPAAILAHFLALVSTGHPGVSLVRHGVCTTCHIRVPSALVYALIKPKELHVCDQCSCYLLLPDDEVPPPPTPKATRVHRPANTPELVA